jgi:peptide/nickel transport system ATP-binding protein/oligopeptide transport system ATP-binding protein
MNENTLLKIQGLCTDFSTEKGVCRAVADVSFEIEKGKTFALVGESGCGKSMTALSIMRLVPNPPGRITKGRILFENKDLLSLSEKQMRKVRGNEIAMIFQEPMTSLNPVYTVGNQIAESIMLHQKKSRKESFKQAEDILKQVGISDPKQRAKEYPHQLSGGMRQRVMIAIAVSCKPKLLIADEPTTALDVTIQAQILDLLDELQKIYGMSIMLITHDLSVVSEQADKVAVMYASRIVEKAIAKDIFDSPLHPYTKGLLKSIPKLGFEGERLDTIPGTVPDAADFPGGCKFHPRCPVGKDDNKCRNNEPPIQLIHRNQSVACWYAQGYQLSQNQAEVK